jgi:hypothetical protein
VIATADAAAGWISARAGEAVSCVPYWCLGFPFMVTGMSQNAVFRAAGRAEVAAAVGRQVPRAAN